MFMVKAAINSLEASLRTQSDVDMAYGAWCDSVRTHMYSTLQYRTISTGNTTKSEGWGSRGGMTGFLHCGIGFA